MMQEDESPDYEALLAAGQENARYKRMMEEQQAKAAMLREQGADPRGQMIGKHYVPPSITQQLGSAASNIMAARADSQGSRNAEGLEKSMGGQNNIILQALMRNRRAAQPAQMPAPRDMPDSYDF